MTNKLKVVSVKLPAASIRRIPGNRSAFIRQAIDEKLARAQSPDLEPKTPFGKKLVALRQRFLDAGGEILDREGVESELRSRRGGLQ